jgi:hypothetical protein
MLDQLFYQGPSFNKLYTEYALKGRIDEKAAIKASGEIQINASVDTVWNVLANLPSWPQFDPNFSDIKVEPAIAVGAKVSFKVKGFPVRGTFAVVTPNQELTWVGKSLWTKAIDRHIVEQISSKTTRLYMEESISGILVPLMFSSARLVSQHREWFTAIKTYIETL